jgi:hypothetical protein
MVHFLFDPRLGRVRLAIRLLTMARRPTEGSNTMYAVKGALVICCVTVLPVWNLRTRPSRKETWGKNCYLFYSTNSDVTIRCATFYDHLLTSFHL